MQSKRKQSFGSSAWGCEGSPRHEPLFAALCLAETWLHDSKVLLEPHSLRFAPSSRSLDLVCPAVRGIKMTMLCRR